MSERGRFVEMARQEGANVSSLCRSFGISRKTGYKWLERFNGGGAQSLVDQPRRPRHSPRQVPAAVEERVRAAREQHPAWGGRKLHHWLRGQGMKDVPAPSTITSILERNGLLAADRRLVRDWQRFEESEPNGLWQMDFKGHFATGEGRCHPLTMLDDHSRYNLCLQAFGNEQAVTVRGQLERVFSTYGLPIRMLMDNGSPWGSDQWHRQTGLTAWLIRLGITVSHGRPYHPQTQGKEERFHRTLAWEVLSREPDWPTFSIVQEAFDRWRPVYNNERPHEAVGNRPPAERYRASSRKMPASLPPVLYEHGEVVRKVFDKGQISFRGKEYLVSRAFIGEPVALRQREEEVWDIYYCHQRVGRIELGCTAASLDPADHL